MERLIEAQLPAPRTRVQSSVRTGTRELITNRAEAHERPNPGGTARGSWIRAPEEESCVMVIW